MPHPNPSLDVAVGVIQHDGHILISLRDSALHQGGLWEFPGGKLEPGETAEQALARELMEELGISVTQASPLITINHAYPDKTVRLIVFSVTAFTGIAHSSTGQALAWVKPHELGQYAFPAANLPIINAVNLPPFYAILDDAEPQLLSQHLSVLLEQNITLIQARLKNLPATEVKSFIDTAYPLCQQKGCRLLINSATAGLTELTCDGLHLASRDLLALTQRPSYRIVGASCHNAEELAHAQQLGVDFAVLAPVLTTLTHPNAPTLGWAGFKKLVETVNLPVYALGGMTQQDLSQAQHSGAQGIASIRAFLKEN
ncbi:Nudix family hydrolase [Methylocucumis oryzae]|uniref:8-oxo-dGTP diphosphatase n=1 Tax=Methylocucumis oryzae TaxID=1632867 RepID=A0A0F3IMB6_9GAMM|nr:Nudix family hydrolase [Methylocucumis oryzae]KJV07900.1 DNA mismatch repair protein MutT [Methylocucumis oryzae]